jgi:hypothetical protein
MRLRLIDLVLRTCVLPQAVGALCCGFVEIASQRDR